MDARYQVSDIYKGYREIHRVMWAAEGQRHVDRRTRPRRKMNTRGKKSAVERDRTFQTHGQKGSGRADKKWTDVNYMAGQLRDGEGVRCGGAGGSMKGKGGCKRKGR